MIITFFILGLLMFGGAFAFAEDGVDQAEVVAISAEEMETIETDILEAVVESDLEEVVKIPSAFGAWWQNIRESIDLTFTFDETKKAVKSLRYAEQKTKIAEKILEKGENPENIERAEKFLEKADKFIGKIEAGREKLKNSENGERIGQVLEGLVKHQVYREKVMNKFENMDLSEAQQEKVQSMRQNALQKSQNILRVVDNEKIPAEVKGHIEEARQVMTERHGELEQFRTEKAELIKAVKEGDEDAREELTEIKDERKLEIKKEVQKFQEIKEEMRAKYLPEKPIRADQEDLEVLPERKMQRVQTAPSRK